jgi:hypothetical protein
MRVCLRGLGREVRKVWIWSDGIEDRVRERIADGVWKQRSLRSMELVLYARMGGAEVEGGYDPLMRRYELRCKRCGGLVAWIDADLAEEAGMEIELEAAKHACGEQGGAVGEVERVRICKRLQKRTRVIRMGKGGGRGDESD